MGFLESIQPCNTTSTSASCNGSSGYDENGTVYYVDPYSNLDIEARMRAGFSDPHVIIQLTLASIAVAFNLFSLLALFHIRSRMNSHYRFIISLSASDTLIGCVILFFLINKIFNPVFAVSFTLFKNLLKNTI